MRETFNIQGPKRKFTTFGAANEQVRLKSPKATCDGSVCHWSWVVKEKTPGGVVDPGGHGYIVAEAWPHRKEGWWLRMAKENR